MGHTPYGYRIENGVAVIDEDKAESIGKLYAYYLSGLALTVAAKKAGVNANHSSVGKMLRNRRYLGDEYYPQIVDKDTFDAAEVERQKRAEKLGRVKEPKEHQQITAPISFRIDMIEQKYEDPFRQAEYAYSQIAEEALNE
nr:recombinase [uncultured Niameybacter sp.]